MSWGVWGRACGARRELFTFGSSPGCVGWGHSCGCFAHVSVQCVVTCASLNLPCPALPLPCPVARPLLFLHFLLSVLLSLHVPHHRAVAFAPGHFRNLVLAVAVQPAPPRRSVSSSSALGTSGSGSSVLQLYEAPAEWVRPLKKWTHLSKVQVGVHVCLGGGGEGGQTAVFAQLLPLHSPLRTAQQSLWLCMNCMSPRECVTKSQSVARCWCWWCWCS
jgi:hypothetical protein